MRRSRLLPLLGLPAAAAAVVAVAPLASTAPSDYQLPDLRSAAPTGLVIVNGSSSEGQAGNLLLRFNGFIDNYGDGPAHFQGNPQLLGANGVRQWARKGGTLQPITEMAMPTSRDPNSAECTQAFDPNASATKNVCVTYDNTDSHNHWHLVQAARYTLEDPAGNLVAPGAKVGFCMYDIDAAPGATNVAPSYYGFAAGTDNFCQQRAPGATSLIEGTSEGRRDVYHAGLAYQWVDVSDTRPGNYRLGNQVDPNNRILEKVGFENNAPAYANVTIPGFVAQPTSASTPVGTPVAVPLGAQTFGGLAQSRRRFRIVSAPSRGSLSVAVGQVISGSSVTYTPAPGSGSGVDAFTYVALDTQSSFPRNPPAATASVTVGTGQPAAVSVSGNPPSLIVGLTANLTASVANADGGVTWSVDGVPGGNAAVGTIMPQGAYTAPAAVPAGGSVTITATSVSAPGASASVTIGIVPAPVAKPQPMPTVPTGAG
ncbi:MAG TPA: lysyl oxidase family protein, partial [Miltoncostaeaceae bacterium]|nr:lysyl oxidase family protein [Miltoncostaeaceae bacterium]